MKAETYRALVALIEQHYWAPKSGFKETTTIADDLGIDGQDGIELMELIATEFNVRMDRFDWNKYFLPEGCNPFSFLLWPLRHLMSRRCLEFFQLDLVSTKAPLTLRQIGDCIDLGQWIEIPHEQTEYEETEQ